MGQRYLAYGLNIASDVALPELTAGEANGAPDVVIQLSRPLPVEALAQEERTFEATLAEARLVWPHIGTFTIRNGSEIGVQPVEGVAEAILRPYLLGASLGVLLHQRGLLVLHASAVLAEDGVIAFVGHKGWGKSTTVAALHQRGYPFVTDDLLVLEPGPEGMPFVWPSFGQIKLWPDAAEALGEAYERLPKVHPAFDKRIKELGGNSIGTHLPLKWIYVLEAGPVLAVRPASAQRAFMEVVQHSYGPRFVGTSGTPPRHFYQCEWLVKHTPLFLLERIPDLTTLPGCLDLIIAHSRSPEG